MEGKSAADPGVNPDAVVRLPVQYWTFTMSNSKESRTATPARRHSRARSLDSSRLSRSLQVMFPSRRLAEGRDPPPVYLNRSSPCSGLSTPATDAHMPQLPPRRNDGAAAVRVVGRSERIAVLISSPVYMTEKRANFKIETHAKYLSFRSAKSFKGKIIAWVNYLKSRVPA